MRSDDDITMLI